ncbi:hypothetical protein GOBAR_AA07200 [Gossypium barbadense]|uniref:N-acetyltransferase domain-containing protein n=1 Tax=Gossypium barbadense TaxID=3634 RepID=A0A2P5YCR7_GOSBA|nr:hypothetical protein GOBAR_AA07200 [Gossypium barbadense]
MGKVEGQGESWHGHVTAVTVAPEYRRQQLAKKLMNLLEDISDKIFHYRQPKKIEMTTIRRFCCNDLLRFASVNLDHLTETFNMSFYMTYLARWPDYFHVAEGPGNRIMGYGKAYFVDLFVRASNTPAIKMYEKFEMYVAAVVQIFSPLFCDHCFPMSLKLSCLIAHYSSLVGNSKLGYVIYRRVLRYYSGEEDGLDMRKALSRDVEKKSIIPLKRPVTPDELEYD